jgi:type IV pilus assembly protein PilE
MSQSPQRGRHIDVRIRTGGFTLIELMIVVAIVAIIAAVALPSYFGSIRKSRRADAVAAVSQIQQAQERWRANNPAYTATLGNLSVTTPTSSGYYALATATLTGNQTCPGGAVVSCTVGSCYSATATAVAGTSQANDTGCTAMTVAWLGPCGRFSRTPAQCWSQ